MENDLLDPGIRIEDQVADEMTTLVKPKPHRATRQKLTGRLEAIHWRERRRRLLRGCR